MSGQLTQADALAVLERNCDSAWLRGHLNDPNGQAVINPWLAVGEAASAALTEQAATCQISEAPAGRPGVATLTLHRAVVLTTGLIPKGFRFRTSIGVDLVTTADVAVGNLQADVTLPLATLRKLELVNTIDPAFDREMDAGDLLDPILSPDGGGVLNSAGQLLLGPDGWIDPLGGLHAAGLQTFTYFSSTAITGAVGDWLEVLGRERLQQRQAGESDGAYRARVRNIQDAVTPIAISQGVQSAASHANLAQIIVLETVNPEASAATMAANLLALADSPFLDESVTIGQSSFLDDPVGMAAAVKLPWRSLEMVGIRESRAYFRCCLAGPLVEPDGSIMYADAAYLDDPWWGYPEVTPTLHPLLFGALMGVAEEANRKRAGGVQTDCYVENGVVAPEEPRAVGSTVGEGVAVGSSLLAVPTVVWDLYSDPLAPPGFETKAWMLREGLVGHDSAVVVAGVSHFISFWFADLTAWQTPSFTGSFSEHLTVSYLAALGFPFKPILRIRGWVTSDGANLVNLAGTFWVSPFVL